MKFKQPKYLESLKAMPPTPHVGPNGFDLNKSPLLNYVVSLPEFRSWLYYKLRDSKVIQFDDVTKTWNGIDYEDTQAIRD